MKQNRLAFLFGVALVGLLGFGLVRLFLVRFQAGDQYPPYSSLRSDPLGTRVFYESLSAAGVMVDRNYRPFGKGPLPAGGTLLVLGDSIDPRPNRDVIPVAYAMELKRFMRTGGRVVLTVIPQESPNRWWTETNEVQCVTNRVASGTNTLPSVTNAPSVKSIVRVSETATLLTTNWLGVGFTFLPNSTNGAPAVRASHTLQQDLPRTLNSHTDLCFSNAAPDWVVLYERNGFPVLMEKNVGAGSLVVSTVSYFLSNEAMRSDRQTALLLWLVGGRSNVVFDETHLGVMQSPDLSSLIRKYHLAGVFFCLLLGAVLFIWRNSTSLVPPPAARRATVEGDLAIGKDSADGLVNLLRRNVPRTELMAACVAAWRRTATTGGKVEQAKIRRVMAMLEAAGAVNEPPEKLYNRIYEALKEPDGK